jgi:transposase InsO family protein
LNHPSEAATRKTAKYYGWILHGTFEKCEHCWKVKAKQKNLNKVQVPRTAVLGERLMIDISSIKAKSYGSSKYWLLIMDDCSDEAWSRFLKKKRETTEQVVALIQDLKEKEGKTVKHIRCDNAGENKLLENECLQQGLGITFEYTAPSTPQHNGHIER